MPVPVAPPWVRWEGVAAAFPRKEGGLRQVELVSMLCWKSEQPQVQLQRAVLKRGPWLPGEKLRTGPQQQTEVDRAHLHNVASTPGNQQCRTQDEGSRTVIYHPTTGCGWPCLHQRTVHSRCGQVTPQSHQTEDTFGLRRPNQALPTNTG